MEGIAKSAPQDVVEDTKQINDPLPPISEIGQVPFEVMEHFMLDVNNISRGEHKQILDIMNNLEGDDPVSDIIDIELKVGTSTSRQSNLDQVWKYLKLGQRIRRMENQRMEMIYGNRTR